MISARSSSAICWGFSLVFVPVRFCVTTRHLPGPGRLCARPGTLAPRPRGSASFGWRGQAPPVPPVGWATGWEIRARNSAVWAAEWQPPRTANEARMALAADGQSRRPHAGEGEAEVRPGLEAPEDHSVATAQLRHRSHLSVTGVTSGNAARPSDPLTTPSPRSPGPLRPRRAPPSCRSCRWPSRAGRPRAPAPRAP